MEARLIALDKGREFVIGGTWHADTVAHKNAFKKHLAHALGETRKKPVKQRPTHYIAQMVPGTGFAEVGTFHLAKKAKAAPLIKLIQLHTEKASIKTWAAIFQIDEETWWFGGAIDGVVLPSSDVYGSYDAVMAIWQEKVSDFGQDSHYFVNVDSPNFAGASVVELQEWLTNIPKKEWLSLIIKPIGNQLSPKAVVAGILIVVIGGWMAWDEYQQREQQAAFAAQLASQQSSQKPAANPTPWNEKPLPSQFVAACDAALATVNPFNAGWKYQGAKCHDNLLVAEFSRDEEWPDAGDIITNNPTVQLTPGGGKATVSVTLKTIQAAGDGEPMANQKLIQAIHTSLPSGVTGANITPDQALSIGQMTGFKLLLKSGLPAKDWADALDKYPTLRLTFVHFKSDYSADIEGIAYAK